MSHVTSFLPADHLSGHKKELYSDLTKYIHDLLINQNSVFMEDWEYLKVGILDITGTAISNGSDSLSKSSEKSYSAATPNWKPFAKSLQELQE